MAEKNPILPRSFQRFLLKRLLAKNPGFFDENFYLEIYPEIRDCGISPFEHYLNYGVFEDRRPNPLFESGFYTKRATGFFGRRLAPALHYLWIGGKAGLQPNYLFDPAFYGARTPELKRTGEDPLSHYRRVGWREHKDPHPFFDVHFYLKRYPDVAKADVEPLQHFIGSGINENRCPNLLFSPVLHARNAVGMTSAQALSAFLDTRSNAEILAYHRIRKFMADGKAGSIREWCKGHGVPVHVFDRNTTARWTNYRIANSKSKPYEITATLPVPYLAVLEDVTCFPGTRLVVSEAGDILHDELSQDRDHKYHHKIQAVANVEGDQCSILAALSDQVIEEALLISSDTDFNYFHLLVEALPKLELAEEYGVSPDLPILVQDRLHKNLVEAITRAVGKRPVITIPPGTAVRVRKLWYASDLSRVVDNPSSPVDPAYDIVLSPEAVRFISRRVAGERSLPPPARNLYLARVSHHRLLGNEAELIAELEKRGFEIVDTGKMTLPEQIDLFGQAKTVIAPTGAALTNLLWCQKGARALILVADNPQGNHNIFNQVAEPLGVETEFSLGKRLYRITDFHTVHDDFDADLDGILRWCDTRGLTATKALSA